MLKLIKQITFILLLLVCCSAPSSGAEPSPIKQTFYNYLALDLSTDILESYSNTEKAPATIQRLTERLGDLIRYTNDYSLTGDNLSLTQLTDSLKVMIANLKQQTSASASVNNAAHHVRAYLKEHTAAQIIGGITQPAYIPSGEWKLTDTVHDGPYKGMSISFRLHLKKGGITFEAEGEKYWENGKVLPKEQRSPIRISGLMNNNVIHAIYNENGTNTGSTGEFVWLAQDDGTISGSFFSSTGAQGRSHLVRLSPDFSRHP